MSHTDSLPDPDYQAEFYDSIPAKRLAAWVVDMLLVGAVSIVIVPFTAFTALFFFPALMLVVGFVYRVVTLTGGSATLGMRLMSMELRTFRGTRFELGDAVLHTLGYTVSLAVPILQLISIVLMLTSARRQGLTDHVMGTVALNRRALG